MGASLGVYIAVVAGIMAIASGVLEVLDVQQVGLTATKRASASRTRPPPPGGGRHEAGDDAFDLRAIAHEMQAHPRVGRNLHPHWRSYRFNPKDADAFDLVIVRGRRISTSTRLAHADVAALRDALRKQLGNARLTAVEQLAFDRLLRMTFTTKGGDRHLIIECFETATSSCSTRTTPSSSL